jgi:hypothetical protein
MACRLLLTLFCVAVSSVFDANQALYRCSSIVKSGVADWPQAASIYAITLVRHFRAGVAQRPRCAGRGVASCLVFDLGVQSCTNRRIGLSSQNFDIDTHARLSRAIKADAPRFAHTSFETISHFKR